VPVCAKPLQQADGSVALVLDQTATDLTTCPYVVETGAELGNSVISFTASDGAMLSSGVVACWLAAYGVRVVLNVIRGSENGNS
jgi:hypothetical protein